MLKQKNIKQINFKQIFLTASFILCLSLNLSSNINKEFETLLDEEWEYKIYQNPVYATSMGVKGLEHFWTDMSAEAINQRKEHYKDLVKRLKKIDEKLLSSENQLNYRLFLDLQLNYLELEPFNQHLMPFSHRGGVQLLHEETEVLLFKSKDDYKNWLIRLSNLDEYIQQIIKLAQEGLSKGYTKPKILMERVARQITLQCVEDPEKSPFYKLFIDLPDYLTNEEKKELQNSAKEIISKEIVPSYKELYTFFINDYLPESRGTFGIYDLPLGKEHYKILAKQFTTTDLSPEEIHQLGLQEVERIRKEMNLVMKEVSFEGSFKEFLNFLREDSQFYYNNKEDLLEAYLATSKRADSELVSLFALLPRTPYGVREIPIESAPDTTTAYYMSPSPDGLRAGYYYVNLYKPETRPKFEIEVLSLHEAVPGHHLFT